MAPGILRPLVSATLHRFAWVGVEILSLKSYSFSVVCGDFVDLTARYHSIIASRWSPWVVCCRRDGVLGSYKHQSQGCVKVVLAWSMFAWYIAIPCGGH